MLFAHEYGKVQMVDGGPEITRWNARRFQIRVELALAACDRVVIDLRRTRLDSWGFSTFLDIHERYRGRLAVVAPNFLRAILNGDTTHAAVPVYARVDEAVTAVAT